MRTHNLLAEQLLSHFLKFEIMCCALMDCTFQDSNVLAAIRRVLHLIPTDQVHEIVISIVIFYVITKHIDLVQFMVKIHRNSNDYL